LQQEKEETHRMTSERDMG